MEIPTIDVLIRLQNESDWLHLLLKSLKIQKGIKINNILILDNNSTDSPETIIKFSGVVDKVIYKKYSKRYIPGEMLNYGIRELQQESESGQAVLIISAHCYLASDDAIKKLCECFKEKGIGAAFGRQIPLSQSPSKAIRDLTLLYPKESRTVREAAWFNNAFSMIPYARLSSHLFCETSPNLEDILWAKIELDNGFKIKYCADAEAYHYHGPHHNDEQSRLLSTRETILANQAAFNITLTSPAIHQDEVLPIIIGVNSQEAANKIIAANPTAIGVNLPAHIEIPSEVNIQTLTDADKPIYSLLPGIDQALIERCLFHPFVLLFDGSIELACHILSVNEAINFQKEGFGSPVWVARPTSKLYVQQTQGNNKSMMSELKDVALESKLHGYEILRGNGLFAPRKCLASPEKLFDNTVLLVSEQNNDNSN